MRIVFLTEGESEYKALPQLAAAIRKACGANSLKVLKVAVTPDAPVGVVARQCADRVRVAHFSGADHIVVILDREKQRDCCGKIADSLRTAITRLARCVDESALSVVLKDQKFENWLIADVDALRAQPARFQVSYATSRKIQPDKADRVDAEAIIKSTTIGATYDKRLDAERICKFASIDRMALNSRSFRHLLHTLRHPDFLDQCRTPLSSIPEQRRARTKIVSRKK